MSRKTSFIEVAQIGKVVALGGELKLHIHSDFPEQFSVGKRFDTDKNITLEIASYNEKRGLVLFRGYESRESAACLVNSHLMTTLEATIESCTLEENEFFWFDIIGCEVKDGDTLLGIVKEMQRVGTTDYMVVKTDEALVLKKLSKTLFIPYIDRYVTSKEKKVVHVKDGLELLECS